MTQASENPGASVAGRRELVIITGLSGSGKATVLRVFEDLGFYSVDNLPIDLLPKFAELVQESPSIRRAALVIDVREGPLLDQFPRLFRKLKRALPLRMLFLEAESDTLVRRFSESRRPHPLGNEIPVTEGIAAERKELKPIRALADHIVDTSKFTVHELREYIEANFAGQTIGSRMLINVASFGFKHGVPTDADLVFDVRFLPNPNYVPEFKPLTGKNPRVARYIAGFEQTREFLNRITDLLLYLIPYYSGEGKSYLTIAFGCTGGQHRSVMMACEVRKRLMDSGYRVKETHRDMPR
ncbi:MAG TPA: RNase adapter RapZ [Bryobacteraceae bacterium]|nr:RNase adapter RapZ [Bryobacteraceae bacterium]